MKNALAAFLVLIMLSSGVAFFLYKAGYIAHDLKKNSISTIEPLEEEKTVATSDSQAEAVVVADGSQGTAAVEQNVLERTDAEVSLSVQAGVFAEHLKSCLDITSSASPDPGGGSLNQSNLLGATTALGEVVLQSEDWSEKDILIEDGKKRRIRLEVNLQEEENLGMQKLQYLEVQPDGQTKEIPLNHDQSVEPDKNLIASLESEGKIIREAKKERVYFPGGEELIYSSIDGQVKNIEIHRYDRTLKCVGTKCDCNLHQAQFDDEGIRPSTIPQPEPSAVEDKSKLRAKAEFQQSLIPPAVEPESKSPVRK